MRADLQVIPKPKKATRILFVCGLVIAGLVAARIVQEFFWPLIIVLAVLLFEKLAKTASDRALLKDNPDPLVYNAEALAVWSQIEKAIKTAPPRLEGVTARIEYSELHPPPGEPMHLQATFTLDHPELIEMRDSLSPEHKSLKSKLHLDAFIKPLGHRSELTLMWQASPIITRARHDEIIDTMTAEIDGLIRRYAKPNE
jgi:hypothetical protein